MNTDISMQSSTILKAAEVAQRARTLADDASRLRKMARTVKQLAERGLTDSSISPGLDLSQLDTLLSTLQSSTTDVFLIELNLFRVVQELLDYNG